MNIIPFGLFLYGLLMGIPWILTTALVIFWIIIALSMMLPYIPPAIFFEKKMGLDALNNTVAMISKAFSKPYTFFNIIQDVLVAFTFAYFGYNVLAIFFILHIFGYLIMYHHIKLYIMEKFEVEAWEVIAENLVRAIDRGETEFSIFELMGLKHPGEEKKDKWGGIR